MRLEGEDDLAHLVRPPYRTDEIWPEEMTGGLRVVELGQGNEQTVAMAFSLSETLSQLK